MRRWNRSGEINVRVLLITTVIVAALVTSLVAARQIRRSILSNTTLAAGNAAFEKGDWKEASREFREYLGRNPDDVAVLKKYGQASLSVCPLSLSNMAAAIAAYRRVLQLAPLDDTAYGKLVKLYTSTGSFDELAYVARTRLGLAPDDREAHLGLAMALVELNKPEDAKRTLDELIKRLETGTEKHLEYVRACIQVSGLVNSDSITAKGEALGWLNRAVGYAPDSAEALVFRSRFYRVTSALPSVEEKDRLTLARKDLEAAAQVSTDDPRIHLALGAEWIAHRELDRATAELQAATDTKPDAVAKYFLDLDDWNVARFLLAAEVSLRKQAGGEGGTLADEMLGSLQEKRHRVRVLPAAVRLYVAAGKVAEARHSLDEYLFTAAIKEAGAEFKTGLAFLQALVARAEERPYAVIDALQPATVSSAAPADAWGLLAEAYDRTDQTRRAVGALIQYLRIYPRDADVMLQLAKEYVKLRDWNKALEIARLAESLSPSEVIQRLLRIEASIHAEAEQHPTIDKEKLAGISAELAQLRQEHPERVDIRLLQSVIASYLGQPEVAERELKSAVVECQEPLRAEMELVRHYYGLKRMADAVAAGQAASKRHPEAAEVWLSLSSLHVANGDYDSARKCLQEGLNAVTNRWDKREVSITFALLDIVYGDRAAGLRRLSDLAAQDSAEIHARSLLLNAREIQNDPATAKRLVEELRKAEGESGLLWRLHQASLGLLSDDWRSRQQDIMDLLRYCINSDPEWSAPALLLAGLYEKLDDSGRVEDTCRQTLVRNPSATDVADKLVGLLEKQGRFSEAQKVIEQVQTDPRVLSAWRVRTALRADDFSRAIEELKLRASNDERDADSRILLARLVYWQRRDAVQALQYLKEAEAVASNSMALIAAKVSILKAEGQTQEAQRILDQQVASGQDFTAYMMRATYLASEGQFDRAEQDYKKLTTFAGRGAAGYELLSNFYAQSQKLDPAVAAVEEGLRTYPEDLVLKRRLMKLLFVRGQTQDRENGLQILAALEEKQPQDPELLKIRALQMLEQATPQSVKVAIQKLETAVRLEPGAVDAHLVLVRVALQEGRYEAARDYAIRALGSNPNSLALILARGKAELGLENTPMAAELVHLALQRDPNNWDAMDLLADAALAGKDSKLLEEARTRIEAALRRSPTDEDLLLSWSRILVLQGRPQTAIPEMEAYCRTEKGSRSVAAFVTLADLYRIAGDMDRCQQKIEQARLIDPNTQVVVHARLLWLVAQNRLEELKGISSAYLSAQKQDPKLLLKGASVLTGLNSAELKKEGLKLFERAVVLSPTSLEARLGLASHLYEAGDAERAEKIYRELLAEHPDNVRILNDLAWIEQEADHRYDAALELANKGVKLAPDDVHLLDTRGTILANLPDRLADARNDFARLVVLLPERSRKKAVTLVRLGRLCAQLNDFAQAEQHIRIALDIDREINVFTAAEREEISKIAQPSGK